MIDSACVSLFSPICPKEVCPLQHKGAVFVSESYHDKHISILIIDYHQSLSIAVGACSCVVLPFIMCNLLLLKVVILSKRTFYMIRNTTPPTLSLHLPLSLLPNWFHAVFFFKCQGKYNLNIEYFSTPWWEWIMWLWMSTKISPKNLQEGNVTVDGVHI